LGPERSSSTNTHTGSTSAGHVRIRLVHSLHLAAQKTSWSIFYSTTVQSLGSRVRCAIAWERGKGFTILVFGDSTYSLIWVSMIEFDRRTRCLALQAKDLGLTRSSLAPHAVDQGFRVHASLAWLPKVKPRVLRASGATEPQPCPYSECTLYEARWRLTGRDEKCINLGYPFIRFERIVIWSVHKKSLTNPRSASLLWSGAGASEIGTDTKIDFAIQETGQFLYFLCSSWSFGHIVCIFVLLVVTWARYCQYSAPIPLSNTSTVVL
jgi:hypothetical protein